ncbi:ABC transporter ATP-binding protein [Opitutus sp. ER46]|uniref:ABC transporter ATP-binding protein n=1 Tax=Opitutus sp. ER46 TaxID=2161864 RepID=UPI001304F27E|nr:ABC transporter ATP-binding protein [Opitutus sp. ER46]
MVANSPAAVESPLGADSNAAPAIEIRELTKLYHRNVSLRSSFARGLGFGSRLDRASNGAVAALDHVSFTVQRGEAFGIIGRNGAGKSTLLQIVAGTLQASSGACRVNGRITALLELGSGFNPEFTGRENIYLAGAILGISRAEMETRYERIVAFADIGDFIDQPVKTYSTGMMMRVAFAVAISVEPDVLIIDEALSVGDILFQQKCSARMRELVNAGVTLLVVTHDTAFVLNMCQRALWLDQGRMRYLGEAGACVREYVTAMAALSGNAPAPTDDFNALATVPLPTAPELALAEKERLGDGGVRIARAWLLHADGGAGSTFRLGDWAVAVVLIRASRHVRGVSAGCELRNRHGQVMFATGLRVARRLIAEIPAGKACLVSIRFRLELQPGQYTLDLGCGAGVDADNTWDRVLNVAVIEVSAASEQEVVHGLVRLPYEIGVSRVAG